MMARSSIDRIVIIGAGRVATHLAIALKKKGFHIIQVWSRTKESASRLANRINATSTTNLEAINQQADIFILSTPDHTITDVLNGIKLENDQILVHTSGSFPLESLNGHAENYGVIYPLQTFSMERKIDFRHIPLLVEGNNEDTTKALLFLAAQISSNIHNMDSEKRKVVHLAAVFANNFPNFMYAIAQDILHSEGISFDILRPLIMETAGKVQKGSPDLLQTGPAIRNDQAIIGEHLDMLAGRPDYKEIYQLITEKIINNSK
jgi:predicted short-subunit dehydrogenase-like oxidoreductase (DUF2520 family)